MTRARQRACVSRTPTSHRSPLRNGPRHKPTAKSRRSSRATVAPSRRSPSSAASSASGHGSSSGRQVPEVREAFDDELLSILETTAKESGAQDTFAERT